MNKKAIRILVLIIGLIVLGFLLWGWTPAGPGKTARAALKSDAAVTIVRDGSRTWFCPTEPRSAVGLIFYPGGHVHYHAYAPVLRRIAESGSVVVVQRMPLSLAVLAPNRAEDSFADTRDNPCQLPIEAWYLGGHSLGGAMAALYVDQHPNQMNGLVLWASYPAESNDLSGDNVRVLSVYASNDGVASEEERLAVADNLPASTTYIEITGGNHAQFGDYGKQNGDGTAAITPEYQWDWVAYVTSEFINPSGQ